RPLQLLGVWPAADFRLDPPRAPVLTYVLIGLVIGGIFIALLIAWRERSPVLPVCVGAAALGALLVSIGGSPWIQGKGFATASPALLLVGLVGAAALFVEPARVGTAADRPRGDGIMAARGLSLGVCVAVTVVVLWGNGLAYGHVTLAPYGQMSELSSIGQRFAGQGPTLVNENEVYASRHFLRRMAPESPSDLRRRPIFLRGGGEVPKGGYSDLDQFALSSLLVYRTIVMRSSPVASRPPSPYRLIYNGRWYQVWQRPRRLLRPVIDSLPLGDPGTPAGLPPCGAVAALAKEAGRHGLLAAAARRAPTTISVPAQLPTGTTTRSFTVASPGQYQVWLGGSLVGHLVVRVDGQPIASTRESLNEPGGFIPLGRISLAAGPHKLRLSYTGASLAPGSAGPSAADPPFTVGPLEVAPPPGKVPVSYVSAAGYRSLCGRPWDWVEALGG
ncbi:MAG TPA: hypothetical protein VKR21_06330, partial [Solirubrobacteraceae bacterium]|nr:hypothetical protein [Solirubrobacteraceae bacterium]